MARQLDAWKTIEKLTAEAASALDDAYSLAMLDIGHVELATAIHETACRSEMLNAAASCVARCRKLAASADRFDFSRPVGGFGSGEAAADNSEE